MYRISESRISESDILINSTADLPISRYPWRIELYPSNKVWYIGAQNVPIQSFSFNMAEKGCMDAKLKFATIDFPVYYGNEIQIFYQGEKRYRGYIDSKPDPRGDQITVTPYSKKLDEITFNTTFTNSSFPDMLSATLTANTTATGVYYNPSMMYGFTSTDIYANASYKYEKITKLIDDYIDKSDDAYWGVEQNGFVYIKTRSTNIDYYIWSGANQAFNEIKPKTDYAKLKATRYNIFQKSTVTNESAYLATIPDGTTNYPYSENERLVGIKYEKLTAPQGLNSTECKDYAYAKIRAQIAPENVKINGLDIRRYDLRIGDRVKVYTETERQLYDLINCDSTSSWIGDVTVDSADYIEGIGSITFNSQDDVYYDFGDIQRYLNISKIVFMVKADTIGNYLNFNYGSILTGYGTEDVYGSYYYGINTSTTDYLYNSNNVINFSVANVNTWLIVELPITRDFRYLGFSKNSTVNASIHIDNIKLYGYFQKSYEGNVIKLSYDIDAENEYLYNAEIGDYKDNANNLLFAMQKKIDILEANNQE